MFNPLFAFELPVLEKLVESGHQYFVRQSYPRGKRVTDSDIKHSFLISHYSDLEKAQQHFSVIKNDPYAFLYLWEDEDHRKKLRLAASKPEGYKLFASLLHPQWQAMLTDILKGKIRYYIEKELKWRPGRSDKVVPSFFLQYGELFVTLRWSMNEVRVNFDDIEKQK